MNNLITNFFQNTFFKKIDIKEDIDSKDINKIFSGNVIQSYEMTSYNLD